MRHLLKPISTFLIALSLALGTVAIASAQDSSEPDPTQIGLFCPDPLCPADACGIIRRSFCVKGSITIFGHVIPTCTCLVVIG